MFAVTGATVMVTVVLMTWPRTGLLRALALGLSCGAATAVLTGAAAFGVCVATGCVG